MPFTKRYENPTGIPYEWVKAYSVAKAQAKFQKQEWAFELETWYKLWEDSGVKEHRGNKPHQYCMVRKDPIEAWGPHNSIIISRRKGLQKQAYERMLKIYAPTEWEDRHAIRKINVECL